ncbi:hypothetical protein F2P81_009671 [Scophthalmus maximus]|uniref:Uncharacterized protein n=1 Tax=Scophthalmus maximus TaxID=52904 RepID=A0A6A4SZP2_SCOMX|nr:hypothetical protein F2P81_009671 [Scophthalmus maximus]
MSCRRSNKERSMQPTCKTLQPSRSGKRPENGGVKTPSFLEAGLSYAGVLKAFSILCLRLHCSRVDLSVVDVTSRKREDMTAAAPGLQRASGKKKSAEAQNDIQGEMEKEQADAEGEDEEPPVSRNLSGPPGAVKESFLHFESADRLDAAGLADKIIQSSESNFDVLCCRLHLFFFMLASLRLFRRRSLVRSNFLHAVLKIDHFLASGSVSPAKSLMCTSSSTRTSQLSGDSCCGRMSVKELRYLTPETQTQTVKVPCLGTARVPAVARLREVGIDVNYMRQFPTTDF